MNIKEYCVQNHISTMQIAKGTSIPYSTVNDILNRKVDIEKVAFGKCIAISNFLGISLEDFHSLCKDNNFMSITHDAYIIVKSQKYYLQFKNKKIYLCKVNACNTRYVRYFAQQALEELNRQEIFKEMMDRT